MELDAIKQQVNSLDIKVDSLDSLGAHLEDAVLKVSRGLPEGGFSIRLVKYDKAKAEGIKAKAVLKEKDLSFSDLAARLFDGQIEGDAKFTLEQNPEYAANLKFMNIDIERFIRDFKLEERFLMTGKFSGKFSLQGRGPDISVIDGEFCASKEGGALTIKDKNFLERVAQESEQPLDLVVERFTDYRYNSGTGKFFRDKGDFVIDIFLEGEKGKSKLLIPFHDLSFLKKGGER
jgi:hypothetical protein